MIEHIARYPRLRDRALFVGDLDDVVAESFGPDLPLIRDWTRDHYDFPGYMTGFDPADFADREALRHELGYRPDERVCIVTVGGSGVGEHLLRRVIDAYPEAARRIDGLRMVVVAGPRIDPATLPAHEGLEIRAYVHDLYRHLAACRSRGRPGRADHLDGVDGQRAAVPLLPAPPPLRAELPRAPPPRALRRRALHGLRDRRPGEIAAAIAEEIGRETAYRPVASDGAARAAALIAELL